MNVLNREALAVRDPVATTERYLLDHGLLNMQQVESIRANTKAGVDRAADEADAYPPPTGTDLLAHIYASDPMVLGEATVPRQVSSEPVTLIDAINHGLREELERNPKIVMWGEDIADPKGGVFGVTRGLRCSQRCGNPERQAASLPQSILVFTQSPTRFGKYRWFSIIWASIVPAQSSIVTAC